MAHWLCRYHLAKPKRGSIPCGKCSGYKRPPVLPGPGKAGA